VDTTKSARGTFPFCLGYFFPSKNFLGEKETSSKSLNFHPLITYIILGIASDASLVFLSEKEVSSKS
jgi:hypothetical protein